MSDAVNELVFDPDALRERYRIERDKRLRADGNEQYVEMTGDFARYLEDPYTKEPIEREPVTDEVDVVLVGGGFGGVVGGGAVVVVLGGTQSGSGQSNVIGCAP